MWYGADAPPPGGHEALSVAPMLDCTDRHFRYLARLLTRRTVLYTEMVWDQAVCARAAASDRSALDELLGRHACESPVVAQLGGASAELMGRAALVCTREYGYDAVNLNAGCPAPSDSCFGARLMREPAAAARICASIGRATGQAPSLKCRIGVDEADSWAELLAFCNAASDLGGVDHLIVHARKALLGLDPLRNRSVPPLSHGVVHALADALPHARVTINGGIRSLGEARRHLAASAVSGVMIGRQAYAEPWLLADADRALFGAPNAGGSRAEVAEAYACYAAEAAAELVRAGSPAVSAVRVLVRPVHGLFHGCRDGARWRQQLARAGERAARRWPAPRGGAVSAPDAELVGEHVAEILAEGLALLSERVREERPADDDREPAERASASADGAAGPAAGGAGGAEGEAA